MNPKRPPEEPPASQGQPEPARKKQKKNKGFSVGPANLPDGTYRRKAQKIKNDLIQKAKVKKAYAKVKAREQQQQQQQQNDARAVDPPPIESNHIASLDLHPDRRAMLDGLTPHRPTNRDGLNGDSSSPSFPKQRHRRKTQPTSRYARDTEAAKELEAGRQERIKAREVRDADRRAMRKAHRPGKDGKMRLGRQSKVLLDRARRSLQQ